MSHSLLLNLSDDAYAELLHASSDEVRPRN